MQSQRCTAALLLVSLAVPCVLFAQQRKTEVLVIASLHAPQAFLMEPGYTPAHVRAALNRFTPTVVGVESNPLWFGHGIFSGVTYEAQYTAVPWAVARGVPVFGIDWQDINILSSMARRGLEQRRRWRPDTARTLSVRNDDARRLAAQIERAAATIDGDPGRVHALDAFMWYNSAESGETVREWWESEGKASPREVGRPVGDRGHALFQSLDPRDNHIVEHILVLAHRYPGSRIAVVLGSGHKFDLDRKLAGQSDVRVAQLADLPPLTAADIAAAWQPLDAIAALRESLDGALYFFNPAGVNRVRVAELLARLKTTGVQTPEVRYLEARRQMIEKHYDEAERSLRELASRDNGAFSYRLTVDWGLTVAQMAQLALGQLYDLRGERSQATIQYRSLLAQLERAAPTIHSDTAFADPGAMATDGQKAFLAVFESQNTREVLHLLLREPWLLSP